MKWNVFHEIIHSIGKQKWINNENDLFKLPLEFIITGVIALLAIGQSPPVEARPTAIDQRFEEDLCKQIKPTQPQYRPIPPKQIACSIGELRIVREEEVNMIINENLLCCSRKIFICVPDIQDSRRLIPKQCKLNGEVNIGQLSNRYFRIRATRLDDYVNLLSKQKFHTHNYWSYPMLTHKWDPCFDPQ